MKALRYIAAAMLVVASCGKGPGKEDRLFTVSFDADGGSPVPEAQHIAYGGYVTEPQAPAKESCAFTGWYTDRGFRYNFVTNPVTRDMTLTARWWKGPKQYVLINDYCYNYDEQAVVNAFGTPEGKDVCAGLSMLMFIFGRSDDDNAKHLRNNLDRALKYDCPILCNFDPITFWDGAPELWNWFNPSGAGYNEANRENVEWYGWGSENAVKIGWLNWGAQCRLKPMANVFSPVYQAAVKARLTRYFGIIDEWYKALPADKKHLLVGVKVVGELAIGVNNWYYPGGNDLYDKDINDDPQTGINMYDKPSRGVQTIGYAAATYSGVKTSGTLTGEDIAKVQCMYSEWLAKLAIDFGFPRELVFTQAGGVGNDLESTINEYSCPSWSFYLGDAADATRFVEAMDLLKTSTAPYWAVSEWAIGADSAPALWASGIKSALDIEGCRYVNICTNVIGNNNGTTINQKAVEGIRQLLK